MSGFAAAAIVSSVTAVLVLLGSLGIHLFGPGVITSWSLVDVAAFAAIAWGIRRLSRVAAIAGLLLFLLERISLYLQTHRAGGIVALLLLLYFVHGVRGTMAYHARAEATPGTGA